MTVQLETFAVRTVFLVVRNLSVPCLLGTAHADMYVKSIQFMDSVVHLLDRSSIALQSTLGKDSFGNLPLPTEPFSAPSNKLLVAQATLIDALSETDAWVHTKVGGLSFLQSSMKPHQAKGLMMANGVADPLSCKAFRVRVMNLSHVARFLANGMVLGYAMPHPTRIVTMVDKAEKTSVSEGEAASAVSPADGKDSLDAPSDWRDEFDLSHLEPTLRGKVYGMLARHATMWDGTLGTIHAATHRIDLRTGARPFHSQPYRASMRALQEEADEIERMLTMGVIELSCSEWASPIVLVPKSDSSLHFCVEYQRLSASTVRDSYPLPRMDECIDSLGDATKFNALDCNSGYWQCVILLQTGN